MAAPVPPPTEPSPPPPPPLPPPLPPSRRRSSAAPTAATVAAAAAAAVTVSRVSDSTRASSTAHARVLSRVMEQPELAMQHESEDSSPDEYGGMATDPTGAAAAAMYEYDASGIQYTPASTIDNPSSAGSGFMSSQPSWGSYTSAGWVQRRGSDDHGSSLDGGPPTSAGLNSLPSPRGPRPTAPMRTPSSTYNPPRRPPQFISLQQKSGSRSMSNTRPSRRDPNAQYQAQEKAYIQQLRQEPPSYFAAEPYTPSLGYSSLSEDDDESPLTENQFDDDIYDQDTQLFYNTDDLQPSNEELQVPANRVRLEWHSMLASVLKGDVVKQEKQRLIGTAEQKGDKAIKNEIWIGVRAKICARSVAHQKRMLDESRSTVGADVDAIANFQIKGESEVGMSAFEQVQEVVRKIERCESLYPTRAAFLEAVPRAASAAYNESCDVVIAWHNITALINTELQVLQWWVGNEELDFVKIRERSPSASGLSDESSFLDRILKVDGLKPLSGEGGMLLTVEEVIKKAKQTLIENASAFARRHLPPYIEELLTLINFPSRLIQEIIRMRLRYAKRVKDSAQHDHMMVQSVISQFQILLNLAVRIKNDYILISQPEHGWDLPPCIDENFDLVILDALKFYFRMLNNKLLINRNTFKEAEILEQEWDFCNEIGRHLDGGDVEVAEQFSGLTAKSLQRLTAHYDRELQRRPDEQIEEMSRRYKQILDSVRVRQRKLFRFSKLLSQRFENATEYNINMDKGQLYALYDALVESGHFLVQTSHVEHEGVYLVASPTLFNRPREIQSILGTSYHADLALEDPSNPYVLILRPEAPLRWDGKKLAVDMRAFSTDLRPGKLRLVADGSGQRLSNARLNLAAVTGKELDVLTDCRANLSRVNVELGKIKKTTYKLSNTIMDSVVIIQKQTNGFENQELIQNCFAFATEFAKRSVGYLDPNRRMMNNLKLTRLALDWVSFICDDCVPSDRKTFKYAVVALEFAMVMTRGPNILSISDEEFTKLRNKVAGCMSLLISHFDIMGARSTVAARAEKERIEALTNQFRKFDMSKMKNDEEATEYVRQQWLRELDKIDELRKEKEAERQYQGRVLEDTTEADRSLTFLSSSATTIKMRWQQGQYIGGGAFGSVYSAINLDSGQIMAVKEIRLQDPQMIPAIATQIRGEMGILEVLDHPNVVAYYGIQVHRDKVCIFMEYCSGGSLANLLEHGRIEDETVMQVYALQMLEGLAYLHSSGIVHYDIKPENILLDHNGVIKYVDFGAARVVKRTQKTMAADPLNRGGPQARAPNKQKSLAGTPMYMSPEVITGADLKDSPVVDIWSVGCVVLEMATGRRPWASLDNEWAIMYNIAQGNTPQLPTHEQLSEAGLDFLRRCFHRDPKRRATAAELLQTRWMLEIREQVALGSGEDLLTPSSEGGTSSGSGGSAPATRHNSNVG